MRVRVQSAWRAADNTRVAAIFPRVHEGLTREDTGPKLPRMTTPRFVRFPLLLAGIAFAAPSFASVVPLCGDHEKGKDATSEKDKNENKDKKDEKKPANPA
jgi:hypothetical protein